jgi:uncharacterized protein YjdB
VNSVVILLTSPNPVVDGQNEKFTAGVNWTATESPTGAITVTDKVTCPGSTTALAVVLGKITLSSATSPDPGSGTLDVSSFPCVGPNLITAHYSGDSTYAPGRSATIQVTVLGQFTSTSTKLTSSINPAKVGNSITFTAQLVYKLAQNSHPTGTVVFTERNSGRVLGTTKVITSGGPRNQITAASLTISSLVAGSHAIEAAYSGDNIYAPSSSPVLHQIVQGSSVESTSTTLHVSATQITAGQSITFSAQVKAASGVPNGSVHFYDGNALLGTVGLNGNGQASLLTSSLRVGTHPITAAYSGSSAFATSSSGVVTVTVKPVPLTPTSTKLSPSTNPATAGVAVALAASVTSTSGTPTGSVTFLDSSSTPARVLGTVGLKNGVATLDHAFAAGLHRISADYSGDAEFAASSGTLSEVVNSPSQSKTDTTIKSSSNPSTYGETVTFTATVVPTSGTATGTVTFHIGSLTATVPLDNKEEAIFTTAALPAGSLSASALYSGDATHAGSTSPILGQTVLGPLGFSVEGSGFVYNRLTKMFTTTLTIKNDGAVAEPGPIQALFSNLPPGVSLGQESGTFNGDPYITIMNGLGPQQSMSLAVSFSDPGSVDIVYSLEFYSGAF